MPPKRVPSETLIQLQHVPDNVRNVSIVAHVDHGKTTLADNLVSSNGIISSRSVTDQIRYMDSREDEQLRGITMKSSAISLHHKSNSGTHHLINLIDSPGHIDFSSEVSTAVRLSDGCLVVVDVVEGVCPQTKAVLRQAWMERLKPVLVLNKIDRLITEKKLTKLEAFQRLQTVLEQANAAVALLFSTEVLKENARLLEEKRKEHVKPVGKQQNKENEIFTDWSTGLEDMDESALFFTPESGNVIFASAIHGWGFSLDYFAQIYSKKMGATPKLLRRVLFGDFYMNTKQRRFEKGAIDKGKEPLFCKFILSYFFNIYTLVGEKNKEKCIEFANQLKIKIYPRDEKAIMSSPDSFLTTVLGQWVPVSASVLNAVIEHVPSPTSLNKDRIKQLLRQNDAEVSEEIQKAFSDCDPKSPVQAAFISKMISIPRTELPQNRRGPITMEEIRARRAKAENAALMVSKMAAMNLEKPEESGDYVELEPNKLIINGIELTETKDQELKEGQLKPLEIPLISADDELAFIAISRVFSGTLRTGDKILALGAKHQIGTTKYSEEIEIGKMYMLMGRDLIEIDSAPAGSLIGIAGIKENSKMIVNTGTLSSSIECPAFAPAYLETVPILRVAVEPVDLNHMENLREGLRLLNIADPIVEILDSVTGELVVGCCGEMHLQKCIDDLEKFYAKCKVSRSDPIVPFRETLMEAPKVDELGENFGDQQKHFMKQFLSKEEATDKSDDREEIDVENCTITLWTPNRQAKLKIQAFPIPKSVREFLEESSNTLEQIGRQKLTGQQSDKMRSDLMEAFHQADFPRSSMTVDQIITVGPDGRGANLLLNCIPDYDRSSFWSQKSENLRSLDQQVLSGFQVAASSGPMMEEPMAGVGFRLLDWVTLSDEEGFDLTQTSGQLISTMKEACRKAYSVGHKRLLAAMYTCDVQASMEVLGKVYGVISKRDGKVIDEDMVEGADIFNIKATMPVIESFGFATEIRGKTSGLAMPQLHFSHWEMVEGDPWWVPTTEEEIQHYGEKADYESTAKKYMNMIRKRKGLWVEQKVVEFGEKQRTITRNK